MSAGSAARSSPAAIPSRTISCMTTRSLSWKVWKSNGGAPCAGPQKTALMSRTPAFFSSKASNIPTRNLSSRSRTGPLGTRLLAITSSVWRARSFRIAR